MRIGLIADVHGNFLALNTVLADLARSGVDHIVCLGDIAALGPQPVEVIARLRDLGCPAVMGNTDAWLVPEAGIAAEAPTTVPVADLTHWCAARLAPDDVAYLHGLQPTVAIQLDAGLGLLCFHGSPRSVDDVIAVTKPPSRLDAMLGGQQAAFLAGGHTHMQLVRRYEGAYVINPGSVGLPGVGPDGPDLPVNREVAWAEYAVLDVAGDRVGVDLRRAPLDVARLLTMARDSGMPHVDWWASKWERRSTLR